MKDLPQRAYFYFKLGFNSKFFYFYIIFFGLLIHFINNLIRFLYEHSLVSAPSIFTRETLEIIADVPNHMEASYSFLIVLFFIFFILIGVIKKLRFKISTNDPVVIKHKALRIFFALFSYLFASIFLESTLVILKINDPIEFNNQKVYVNCCTQEFVTPWFTQKLKSKRACTVGNWFVASTCDKEVQFHIY